MPNIYGTDLGEAVYTVDKVESWEIVFFSGASIFLIVASYMIFKKITRAMKNENQSESSICVPNKVSEFEIVASLTILFSVALLSFWGIHLFEKHATAKEYSGQISKEATVEPPSNFETQYQSNSLQSAPNYPAPLEGFDFEAALEAKKKESQEKADNLENQMIQRQMQDLQFENQRLQREINTLQTEQTNIGIYDSNPNH